VESNPGFKDLYQGIASASRENLILGGAALQRCEYAGFTTRGFSPEVLSGKFLQRIADLCAVDTEAVSQYYRRAGTTHTRPDAAGPSENFPADVDTVTV